ncbi:MAG: NADH-quinone oxidoreductase subunit J [Bacteroidetes bacterium]|nr:NADH-quinone oxidoreductase subunit J [Bacteroidota bacterium]
MLEALFIGFATLIGLAAAFMARTRNLVHAGFALFFLLFAQAALYVLAGAEFTAIAQLVVYVGGVLLLVLYGVMLTARSLGDAEPQTGVFQQWPAALLALGLFILLLAAFPPHVFERTAPIAQSARSLPSIPHAGAAEATGFELLTGWLLPFEVAGVFLLVALIGAAYLSRHSSETP